MTSNNFTPIGYTRTSYNQQTDTPVQARYGSTEARIVIKPEYREGLDDLDGFQRIWLLSWLHQSTGYRMKVIPHSDTVERGLFSTRAPHRPNQIGLSLLEIVSIDRTEGVITAKGIDLLDGTPVLDIKPYIPSIDAFPDSITGWHGRKKTPSNQNHGV